MKIALINGPNLNLLGTREPEVYGNQTLDDIVSEVSKEAKAASCEIWHYQSNVEGELVDAIQKAAKECQALIINPAAYTHTSVAIRDALSATNLPAVEVHISNIYKREEFRHHSYVSAVVDAVISGCGADGYLLALSFLLKKLSSED